MPNATLPLHRLLLGAALALAIGATQPAAAQDDTPPNTGGPTITPDAPTAPTAVPLDGGASLLLAGGVAYGLRQLRQRRRAK